MISYNCIEKISDPEIREGVRCAIEKNLLPAQTNESYPGHFTVTADGCAFGRDSTWPGLNSWQMAGAYLLLGMDETVKAYFDFVLASQREDGNIPFAIWSADEYTTPESRTAYARGLKYPDDVFSYTPPTGNYPTKNWIGLFTHWESENPLSLLGTICYPLTAIEIYDSLADLEWIKERLPSLEKACQYILKNKSPEGLIGGAGFYIELPPRKEWDGITQCYTYLAFLGMSRMYEGVEDGEKAAFWKHEAEALREAFHSLFWINDHFAEYIHPEHGKVDWHGFSDVDWAAIAYGLADENKKQMLMSKLTAEKAFWWGEMPTQIITKPYTYREWEFGRKVPFETNGPIYDMAAIGRVWFIEMNACLAMENFERVKEAVRLVCKAGLTEDGYWYERYHMLQSRKVSPGGPKGYCEYAAILVRIVLGNLNLFIDD